MAVIDRAFSAVPFYRMEYPQTSHLFLQRTNTPGIVDSSILGTAASELGQISRLTVGSGLNSNEQYHMHNQFNANSSHAGENGSLFLGVAAQNQSPAGIPSLPQIRCSGRPGRSRKHRLEEDNSDCPMKKRRFSTSSTPAVFQDSRAPGIFAGGPQQPLWASSHSQGNEAAVPTVADQSPTMMHPVHTEEMEEVVVESQSDAVLRRLRDIESRLVVEDSEEEDDDNSRDSHLPTLVMSDVLVEGFKKGLDESLTRKIVASINRPSMELVLWKPQPKFLVNKLESVASSYDGDKEAAKEVLSPPATALLQEVKPSGAQEPCPSNVDTGWNRDEEEMEL